MLTTAASASDACTGSSGADVATVMTDVQSQMQSAMQDLSSVSANGVFDLQNFFCANACFSVCFASDLYDPSSSIAALLRVADSLATRQQPAKC
jgi:hypothetical protein